MTYSAELPGIYIAPSGRLGMICEIISKRSLSIPPETDKCDLIQTLMRASWARFLLPVDDSSPFYQGTTSMQTTMLMQTTTRRRRRRGSLGIGGRGDLSVVSRRPSDTVRGPGAEGRCYAFYVHPHWVIWIKAADWGHHRISSHRNGGASRRE